MDGHQLHHQEDFTLIVFCILVEAGWIGYLQNQLNYQYFPGASNLQYSPKYEVVIFLSIPATSILASATGLPSSMLTIPLTPAWTASM